jgi:DNA-binding IclR family transcriptional regulator
MGPTQTCQANRDKGRAVSPGSISEVQAITRASRILAALEASPGGLSLAQIAQRVELPRSTVHRIVKALTTERFLVPVSAAGGVRLGPRLAGLASAALGELRQQIRPHLERLSEEVNETVDLAVLDRDQVIFIDQVAAPHRLQAVSAVGARFPAHCTANGKALLAELDPEQVRALLPARLPRLTQSTVTSRARLLEELARVRRDGVAFDNQEHTAGICAIGRTIPDGAGGRAAVTIPLPALRFEDREPLLANALARTCARLAELLEGSRGGASPRRLPGA